MGNMKKPTGRVEDGSNFIINDGRQIFGSKIKPISLRGRGIFEVIQP